MSLGISMEAWERIDTLLEAALSTYLSECQILETSVTEYSSHLDMNEIKSSLGNRLDTFHTHLTQKLVDARSCLARTHNKLFKAPYCLPEEILAQIFQLIVNDFDYSYSTTLEEVIRSRYKRLHRLLSVCTTWRRACISHGNFWSVIPLITKLKHRKTAIDLTLGRSKESRLHLAGMVDCDTPAMWFYSGLAEHGPRFSSINLYTEEEQEGLESIRDTLSVVLKSSEPGRLTELALHAWKNLRSLQESEYLFPQGSTNDALLNRFSSSFISLRTFGVNFHWGGMTLMGLVELRLQRVHLTSADLAALLVAAASAPKLQRLHITTIITIDPIPTKLSSHIPATLPALQYLFLEDLYQDTLEFLLRSVRPGPYRTILGYSTGNCFFINTEDEETYVGPEAFELEGSKIDVLMLCEDCIEEEDIRPLLRAMPTLKELYIHDWHLTRDVMRALTRLPGNMVEDGIPEFPNLQTLYLTSCDIDDISNPNEFKAMVASHGIRELGLSVSFKVPRAPGEEPSDVGSDSDASVDDGYSRQGCLLIDPMASGLKDWLDSTVPKINYSMYAEDLPEPNFGTYAWKL